MNLYAPKYYKDFVCIADKCKHSCCVGWEIDVDADTMQKYVALTDGYGSEIEKSIDRTDMPHFRLGAGERCPHLNEVGLCKIILSLGEGYLCDICREHPRFYHDTVRGKEVGLGMACEEASRLILNSDDYREMIVMGELVGDAETVDFDVISHREQVYSILSDRSVPYPERLNAICCDYNVSLDILTDDEWRELLASLEYLDDAHRALFSKYSSAFSTPTELEKQLERALAYFLYRHASDACDEEEFRAALGFALFCERLLASVARTDKEWDMVELARIVSEEIEYSQENTDAVKLEFFDFE